MTLHLNKWKHSPLAGGTGIILQAQVPFNRCTLELFGLFVISQLRYKWPNQTLFVKWKWMGGLYVNIPCLGSKSAVCLWFQQNLLLLVAKTDYRNPPCRSSQHLPIQVMASHVLPRLLPFRESVHLLCSYQQYVLHQSTRNVMQLSRTQPFSPRTGSGASKKWKLSFSSHLVWI